jgi:ABC-2 type transport system ATP-binding protein
MSQSSMIETIALTKNFDSKTAVDAVSFQVGRGEILALLGPNGAGKTTTTRMLAGILRPTSGDARVAGFNVRTQTEQVRMVVGVLTEYHGLYPRMQANEYLDYFGQLYGLTAAVRRKRASDLLDELELRLDSGRWLAEYSKGMRQRLALVRVLMHDPCVLLLDEPTSALDPQSARLVRNLLRRLRSEGRAILACTHNLSEAEELADRIAILRQGRLIELGTTAELRARLLGAPVYELRFAARRIRLERDVARHADVIAAGSGFVRFRTDRPAETNPAVLSRAVERGARVTELCEVTPSLEEVYLRAVAEQAAGPDLGDEVAS